MSEAERGPGAPDPNAPGGYPPQVGGYGPPPGWGGPYGAPPGWPPSGYQQPPKTSGKAIVILVLGISSLIMCLGIPGIIALCLAPGAKRELAASRGALTGEGLVKAGVICSWISLALALLAVVLLAAILAITVSTGGGTTEIIQTPTQLRVS